LILEFEMIRTLGFAIAVIIVFTGFIDAQAENGKLIPVKSPESVTVEPKNEAKEEYPMPAPRDQMYIFWALGRVISFPVDVTESFIRNRFKKEPVKEGSPVKASAGEQKNPFDNINWREIPPAPPVSNSR
jgi:hypothetical protein